MVKQCSKSTDSSHVISGNFVAYLLVCDDDKDFVSVVFDVDPWDEPLLQGTDGPPDLKEKIFFIKSLILATESYISKKHLKAVCE